MFPGILKWIARFYLLVPDFFGQRLKTFLFCHIAAGFPFLLVGKVEILKGFQIFTALNLLLKFICKFILFINGFENSILTIFKCSVQVNLITNRSELFFIKSAGSLLPVAGEERNSGPVIYKVGNFFDLFC